MKRSDSVPGRVQNKFLHYMLDLGLGPYVINTTTQTIKTAAKKVSAVLEKNNIPRHWIETINKIIVHNKIILPDHEYLSLQIGNKSIFSSTFNPEEIRAMKGQTFCLAINGQVSPTEIKQFVVKHGKLISEISALLELPEATYEIGTSYQENLMAVLMKDGVNLTYKEIHSIVDPCTETDLDYSHAKKRVKQGRKNQDKK